MPKADDDPCWFSGHKGARRKSCKMSRRHSVIPLAHMHVLVVSVCVTHQIFDILTNCIWKVFFSIAIWGCEFSVEITFQNGNKTVKTYA